MSTTTLEIVEGIQERASRISLKKTMSVFGEVDACHMGDRAVMGDNFTEFPIVRFKTQSAAEAALAALKSGQVYLDGFQLKGEWRGGGGRSVRQRKEPPSRAREALPDSRPEEDTSSRMLLDTPSGGRRQTQSAQHGSFAARDDRRDDAQDFSSRSLLYEGPAGRSYGNTSGGRRRSPSRRRSRSRRRRRSPSRSPSAKKKRFSNPSAQAAVPPMLVLALPKAQDRLSMGNAENSISDNPLFKGKS